MILLSIIQDELSKRSDQRVFTFDEKHTPDIDWCLYAVSALNPQPKIFYPITCCPKARQVEEVSGTSPIMKNSSFRSPPALIMYISKTDITVKNSLRIHKRNICSVDLLH